MKKENLTNEYNSNGYGSTKLNTRTCITGTHRFPKT